MACIKRTTYKWTNWTLIITPTNHESFKTAEDERQTLAVLEKNENRYIRVLPTQKFYMRFGHTQHEFMCLFRILCAQFLLIFYINKPVFQDIPDIFHSHTILAIISNCECAQTDRQTYRHTQTHTCTHTHRRERERERYRQTDRQTETERDRDRNRQKQTDRQTDRQRDRETERQTFVTESQIVME